MVGGVAYGVLVAPPLSFQLATLKHSLMPVLLIFPS